MGFSSTVVTTRGSFRDPLLERDEEDRRPPKVVSDQRGRPSKVRDGGTIVSEKERTQKRSERILL